MTEHQRHVTEVAAQILAGILSGRMASNPAFDIGSIRPMHVQGAVNIAQGLIGEVYQRVPPEAPEKR